MKPITISALASALAATAALACQSFSTAAPAAAATAPPTPPPIDAQMPEATATPIAPPNGPQFPPPANPAAYGSAGGSATPSPTPPPDARKGLEGVWEVQIQYGSTTDYTHFKLAQAGTTLSGTYLDRAGKKYPLAGSVDGQAIRLIVTMPDGTTLLMEGRLDGTTDMIGMLTTPKAQVPFTAAYRPREKWIENVNPAPGGLGTPGGATGGGSGGGAGPYNPPRSR